MGSFRGPPHYSTSSARPYSYSPPSAFPTESDAGWRSNRASPRRRTSHGRSRRRPSDGRPRYRGYDGGPYKRPYDSRRRSPIQYRRHSPRYEGPYDRPRQDHVYQPPKYRRVRSRHFTRSVRPHRPRQVPPPCVRAPRPRHRRRRSDSEIPRGGPGPDEAPLISSSAASQKHRRSSHESQHLTWFRGMMLRPHLRVMSKLGEGTFGRVLSCYDSERGKVVAAKIIRSTNSCAEAALCEAAILQDIMNRDPEGNSGIVHLYDCFELAGGHVCLVMERLGIALYDFLLENNFRPFLMRDIQTITRDCLRALSFLRLSGITHTDLKPENILLVDDAIDYYQRDVGEYGTTLTMIPHQTVEMMTPEERKSLFKRPRSAHIKVVDFGSAAYDDEDHSSLINTRQYRAPEVILDIGWDISSDMWSFGCILVELYTGQLLFQTHEHFEHLAMMERIIGTIPKHMLQKAHDLNTQGAKYATNRGTLAWPPATASSASIKLVESLDSLELHIGANYIEFLDLVKSLLQIDPASRPTPQELLQHPFLLMEI
eukprot:Blabericola_migrator_1__8142@NODE_41_length_17267_cov_152_291279_g37_i0_p3_GENE_NODE_41_length_17267_cov_152_291279_g37_i0NODE_41_length_17267_cov_152_291279_g37_i0_p3_ORF_typecomplete_len541_score51_63Pkinase/PF00069_25/2_4e53Pkinase_Tyr/PF07714_17/1_9e26Pkinase_fungal/PF17667_1/2_9e07Kinaselike/PF14531_6/5_1e05Kdo/PF06293_14/0_00062RIO1/PF01163_22/0_12_NODE_41_length_17267_cov_152_291279_g37_i01519916821